MTKPKVLKNNNGGYYILCCAESQPWAAMLAKSEDGETIKRNWIKVRHARAEEAGMVKLDEKKTWAVIVPKDTFGVCEIGRLDAAFHGDERARVQIEETRIAFITREEAEAIVLGKSDLAPCEVEEGAMPF